MTKEDAIAIFKGFKFLPREMEAVDIAIKALEKAPCEDAISRTELLARIDEERKYLHDLKMDGAEHIVVHHARRIIEDMPSVIPHPKIGHWEWVQYDGNPNIGNWHCSECRSIVIKGVKREKKSVIFPLYKYCPQCETKMEEVEE